VALLTSLTPPVTVRGPFDLAPPDQGDAPKLNAPRRPQLSRGLRSSTAVDQTAPAAKSRA
jgi:hypothetical protein